MYIRRQIQVYNNNDRNLRGSIRSRLEVHLCQECQNEDDDSKKDRGHDTWDDVKHDASTVGKDDIPELPLASGMVTIRIELSALPETRRLLEGLNLMTVGGNSWAFRMVAQG